MSLFNLTILFFYFVIFRLNKEIFECTFTSCFLIKFKRDTDAVRVHWDMWVTARSATMPTNASWLDPVFPEYGASISIPDTDATDVRQVTPDL